MTTFLSILFDKKIDGENTVDKVSDHMPNFLLVKDITETKNIKKQK